MEDGRQTLVVQMIGAAVMAGAYWALIRQDQALEAGFGKLAAKHSRAATRLADEVFRAAHGLGSGAARFACDDGRIVARRFEEEAPDA